MVRKVLAVSDPRLRQVSRPVQKVDKKLLRLINDLKDTLSAQKDPEGIGLAAPQIGQFLRVFLIKHQNKPITFINPEVVEKSEETNDPIKKQKDDYIMEGCLSLPHYYGPVQRAAWIKVKYQTPKLETGNWKLENKKRKFTGFVAQVIQHEIDHLEGKVFIDRLFEQNRKLFKDEGRNFVEVEL